MQEGSKTGRFRRGTLSGMAVIDRGTVQQAALAASDELSAKASAVLAQFELNDDAAVPAAAGAAFVSVVANWAASLDLLAPETATTIEALAGIAIEAMFAVAFPEGGGRG